VQRRGGMGKAALSVKDEDFVEHLLIANTHDTLLCFTNLGKVYWLKVYSPDGRHIMLFATDDDAVQLRR
jgi:DNA gyrase/topoisomerase IV subunit A